MIVDHKFGSNRDQRFHQTTGPATPRRWRAAAPALLLVGLVIMGTTAIAARAAIVSIAPATAGAYALAGMPVNLRGLSIADVRVTARHEADSPGELLVTGEITNLRDRETAAPKSAPGVARRGWARALRLDDARPEDAPRRS